MPATNLRGVSVGRAEAAVYWEAMLSVVVGDGAPYQSMEALRLPVNNANSESAKQDRRRNLGTLAKAIRSAQARTTESDLLTGLDLAARAISSAKEPQSIVALDSGLSTTGAVDFTKPGVLDADPETLAAELAKAGQLPDLSGIDVVLQGIGDTTPPQPRLGQPQRDNLKAIWKAIIMAAGADSVQLEQTPVEGEPCDGLPPVTPVPVPDEDGCTVGTVELDEGALPFKPESAEFLDPAGADEVLRPIAERMNRESLDARLTGTTARVGDSEGQQELSLNRARAVMSELVRLRVAADQMMAEGLGSQFTGYVEDHDADGKLVEDKAAANRQVFIHLHKSGSVACA
jgi:outer membrane protein OmpA-like peptidoglycan-associated protein